MQRGTASVTSSSTPLAITGVDPAKSFVLTSNSGAAGDVDYDADDFVRAQLDSATELDITHGGAAARTVEWQVVEFEGASVQRGAGSLTGTATSAAVPISTVDLSRSIALISWRTDTAGSGANGGSGSA